MWKKAIPLLDMLMEERLQLINLDPKGSQQAPLVYTDGTLDEVGKVVPS